jgi:purine-binding chemotaxis protein CheW
MTPAQRERAGTVDWAAVRERLEHAQAATEGALRLSAERAREVLDERARALARAPAEERSAGETVEVVRFALADERYALEAKYVRGIARLTDFTPVPGTPEFILGVTSLRGEILAVVDLRRFFEVKTKGLTDLSRLIILGLERAEFGVLADAAQDVVSLPVEELLEPPESVAGVGKEYVKGVTKDALIVLDAAVLLKDERLFVKQDGRAGVKGD